MNILEVKDLRVRFGDGGNIVNAVDGVSFNIEKNSVFGLVGESGSGKTLTALSIIKLIPEGGRIISGSIMFNGRDLIESDERTLRAIRGSKIATVFQDPSSSLDPVFTIGNQVKEAILAHQDIGDPRAKELAIELLRKVHIADPRRIYSRYPHELSGGMKQRIGIASALANAPELLILDEPTTALDVTIQAQILGLLEEIIEKEKLSILFISHDFGIISRMCDEVGVMHKGRIAERGKTDAILSSPKEDYTISLLESVKALT